MARAYTHAELAALCQGMHPTLDVCARGPLLAAQNDEPEPSICPACNGSGEGQYDGTRCRSCGGSGVERTYRDEPDWDAMRKDRIERELAAEWADQNGDE